MPRTILLSLMLWLPTLVLAAEPASRPVQTGPIKVLLLPFAPLSAAPAEPWIGQAVQQNLLAELSRLPTVQPATTIPAEPVNDPATARRLAQALTPPAPAQAPVAAPLYPSVFEGSALERSLRSTEQFDAQYRTYYYERPLYTYPYGYPYYYGGYYRAYNAWYRPYYYGGCGGYRYGPRPICTPGINVIIDW